MGPDPRAFLLEIGAIVMQATRAALAFVVAFAQACGPTAGAPASDDGSAGSSSFDGGSAATSANEGSTASTGTSATTSTPTTVTTDTPKLDVGGASASSATTDGGPPPRFPSPCIDVFLLGEDALIDPSLPAGLEVCGEEPWRGAIHRVEAVACAFPHLSPPCDSGDVTDCGYQGECAPGLDCLAYGPGLPCFCDKSCMSDADCPQGMACLCASGYESSYLSSKNRCIPADCVDDLACGAGQWCKLAHDICMTPEALRCTTDSDDCREHADCPRDWCRYDDVEELWTCDSFAICE